MKTCISREMLRWSVSAVALISASLGASESFAQVKQDSSGSADAAKVEEVVVTARKRAETIKDVPIAITAVTAQQLQREGVTDLYSLALTIPGFTAQSIGGTYQAPVFRGLSQVDQTAVIGNVGVFIDGVYLNNRDGLDFGFLDLDRVEVLKGPQSALYGENTFSGAIDYVTKAPDLNRYDGYVTGGFGNDGYAMGRGSLNLPIAGIAALRVAVGRSNFDGTIPDTQTGKTIGGGDQSTYSASLLVQPIDDLRLKAFYERTDSNMQQVPYAFLPTSSNNCGDLVPGPNGNRYSLYCGKLPVPSSVALSGSPATGLVGFNALSYVSADYDMKWATLTATASYTNAQFHQFNDLSGNPTAYETPFFPGYPFSGQEYLEALQPVSNETSYDLRLTSPSGGKITWMAGFFTYQSLVDSELALYLTPIGSKQPASTPFFGDAGNNPTIGRALYGVFGYDVTPRWNVRVEGRLAEDDQKFITPGSSPLVSGQQKYSYFLPRVSTTFKLDPNNTVYASAAEGYKLGGFNANAFGLPQFTFGPEKNWTYEVGVKGSILDRKLEYDADVYYITWTGIQIQENIPQSQISVTQTDKGATDYGIEARGTYYFTPNLWVRAGFTVLNPTYISGTVDGEVLAPCGDEAGLVYLTKGCSSEVGGKQLARTSDAQADLSAQWTVPNLIGSYRGYIHGDYSYQAGIHYFSIANDSQGAINLVNGRAGLTDGKIEFAIWVKNLLDFQYLVRSTSEQSASDGTGVEATRLYPGARRTFGGEATYRF